MDKLQNDLFTYVLHNESLDEYAQYLGIVKIIEQYSKQNLLKSGNYKKRKVPKLSETCCAEPNKIQLERIKSNKALI